MIQCMNLFLIITDPAKLDMILLCSNILATNIKSAFVVREAWTESCKDNNTTKSFQ